MFCAQCGGETTGSPCTSCGTSPYLEGRFRLEQRLSRSGGTTSWLGVDIVTRQRLVLREIPINGRLEPSVEARLADTGRKLQATEHAAIPKHIQCFRGGDAADPIWWVARAWVDATPLVVQDAWPEKDVLELLTALLPALGALHRRGLRHGGVSPERVLRKVDGGFMLVDPPLFEEILLDEGVGGGVPGAAYAAPEARTGAPTAASDLYALGLLAAALATGTPPDGLKDHRGAWTWTHRAGLSPATVALITELLTTDPARRPDVERATASLVAARSNPGSVVGIATEWEEIIPSQTPGPARGRHEPEPDPYEAPTPAPSPTPRGVPAPESTGRIAPPAALKLPSIGPLPLATPGPLPPPPRGGGLALYAGFGCLGVLVVALGAGVAVGVAVGLGADGGTAPTPTAPIAPPVPTPAPLPAPTPPPAPVTAPVPDAGSAILEGPRDPGNGVVRVRCDRRALVSINGRAVDRTPVDVELAPGRYTVTAVIAGVEDWEGERVVDLSASEVEEVFFHP
jgi:hypothetical protein